MFWELHTTDSPSNWHPACRAQCYWSTYWWLSCSFWVTVIAIGCFKLMRTCHIMLVIIENKLKPAGGFYPSTIILLASFLPLSLHKPNVTHTIRSFIMLQTISIFILVPSHKLFLPPHPGQFWKTQINVTSFGKFSVYSMQSWWSPLSVPVALCINVVLSCNNLILVLFLPELSLATQGNKCLILTRES